MTSLSMTLPRLPALSHVGGNAWHAHHMQRAKAWRNEQYAWMAVITEQGSIPVFEEPAISGPLCLEITCHFRRKARPDFENLAYGLKPLVDLLETWRIVNDRGHTRGHLGWISDDNDIVWPWLLYDCVGCKDGPRTDVTVTPTSRPSRTHEKEK